MHSVSASQADFSSLSSGFPHCTKRLLAFGPSEHEKERWTPLLFPIMQKRTLMKQTCSKLQFHILMQPFSLQLFGDMLGLCTTLYITEVFIFCCKYILSLITAPQSWSTCFWFCQSYSLSYTFSSSDTEFQHEH